MKPVTIETVETFVDQDINSRLGSHGRGVTGSYLQADRHAIVSERFQPIQPAMVGAELSKFNFSLVSLITGRGRHADKADFQRTVARYRSTDSFEIEGLSLDLIYISKHMGRGQDEIRLGLYRGVCANQWAVGTLFDSVKFRHTGNALADLTEGFQRVLSQRAKLVDAIERMRNTTLTADQVTELAKEYAAIRLDGRENVVSVNYRSLGVVKRSEDAKLDLWTVANVLQENTVRMPLEYAVNSTDKNGQPTIRHMHTRRLKDSSAQLVDLNGKLFDAALKRAA